MGISNKRLLAPQVKTKSNRKPHHCLTMLESTRRDQLSPPKSNSEVSFKGLLNSNTFTFWSHHKGKIKWKATLTVLCTAAFAIFETYISVFLFQWVSRKATLVLSAAYFKWITVSGGQALLWREQVNKVLTAIFTGVHGKNTSAL